MEARAAEGEEVKDVSLDVICAGEAQWKVALLSARSSGVTLRPSGGAVNVALALARAGLRVGLATVLDDDDFGRRSLARIAEAGVDVGGVMLARPRGGLVVVDATGGTNKVAPGAEANAWLAVPEAWSSELLLLSGLSPGLAHAAALCREARRARRRGTMVAIDFNASLHAWAGRDARTIRMVLREVDVARCSVADLAVLGMELAEVRAVLRETAVLVVSDAEGGAIATGSFGEVAMRADATVSGESASPRGGGDAFTAAMCAELLRRGEPGESVSARWHRALVRGRAAALAALAALAP